jgi:hypothetical protein
MKYLRKINRYIAVFLLLVGLLASNPVMGMCLPMMSSMLLDVSTVVEDACCGTQNKDMPAAHVESMVFTTHGCDCCGCGLEQDQSSMPVKQSVYAIVGSPVSESLNSWKTASTSIIAILLPDSGSFIEIPSSISLRTHSRIWVKASLPPLFIIHQSLLN